MTLNIQYESKKEIEFLGILSNAKIHSENQVSLLWTPWAFVTCCGFGLGSEWREEIEINTK